MQNNVAKILLKADKLSYAIQKKIYDTGDSELLKILAKRKDLSEKIENRLIENITYLDSWLSYPERSLKNLKKIINHHHLSEQVALSFTQQKKLDSEIIENLLNYNYQVVAYSLLKNYNLKTKINLRAKILIQYLNHLPIEIDHPLKEKILSYVGDNANLIKKITKNITLNNFFILEKLIKKTDKKNKEYIYKNIPFILKKLESEIINYIGPDLNNTFQKSSHSNEVILNKYANSELDRVLMYLPLQLKIKFIRELESLFHLLKNEIDIPEILYQFLEKSKYLIIMEGRLPQPLIQESYRILLESNPIKKYRKKELRALKIILKHDYTNRDKNPTICLATVINREHLTEREISAGIELYSGPSIREIGELLFKNEDYPSLLYYAKKNNSLVFEGIPNLYPFIEYLCLNNEEIILKSKKILENKKYRKTILENYSNLNKVLENDILAKEFLKLIEDKANFFELLTLAPEWSLTYKDLINMFERI